MVNLHYLPSMYVHVHVLGCVNVWLPVMYITLLCVQNLVFADSSSAVRMVLVTFIANDGGWRNVITASISTQNKNNKTKPHTKKLLKFLVATLTKTQWQTHGGIICSACYVWVYFIIQNSKFHNSVFVCAYVTRFEPWNTGAYVYVEQIILFSSLCVFVCACSFCICVYL